MLINSAPRGSVLVDASAKTPTWRRHSRRACLPDQARGGYQEGVDGALWRLRRSYHPTRLASQFALQLTRSSRRNSVHKCPKTATRGHFHRSVYTPLSPRPFVRPERREVLGTACTAKWHRTYRSGTLGVEWQCHPHEAARSGASGSASHTAKWHRAYQSGTLRPEWQCDRYAQG